MNSKIYDLKVIFTEPLLGTQSTKDVATNYLQEKAKEMGIPVDDELETLPEMLEKGTTVFHKNKDGNPMIFDYFVLGFLKYSAKVQNPLTIGKRTIKQLKSLVGDVVFVDPRRIDLVLPPKNGREYSYDIFESYSGFKVLSREKFDILERPLRAETARGERVALARSEILPIGTSFSCQIVVWETSKSKDRGINADVLKALLDYGRRKGFGCWRNASFGRFEYKLTPVQK